MSKHSGRDRLAILPGGQDKYVGTVLQILRFVAERGQQVPIDEVGQFLSQTYNTNNHRPNEPVWDLVMLGLLAVENRRLSLTPTGQTVLDAEPGRREQVVLNCALTHFAAVLQLLQFAANARQAFSCREGHLYLQPHHPTWNDPQMTRRPLNWLVSTGALRDVGGARYEITPRGRTALSHFTTPANPPLAVSPAHHLTERSEALIVTLQDAQFDSVAYQRLERAAAEAFDTLGYEVEIRGERGDTDILAVGRAMGASYRFIVDAKTCRTGRWAALNTNVLHKHAQRHQADYIVVLAPEFAEGYTVEDAIAHGIVLLPVRVLCDWLRLHAVTPLNVVAYRVMFETPGLISHLPDVLCTRAAHQERLRQCLGAILHIIATNAQYGADNALASETIYMLLVREQRHPAFSIEHVGAVCELLTNAFIGAAFHDDTGKVSIAMLPDVIGDTLVTLAASLSQNRHTP